MNGFANYTFDNVAIFPDKQIGLHSGRNWELSYVVYGRGIRTLGNSKELFGAGDLVLVPPEMPHCWQFDPEIVDENGCIKNITLFFEESFFSSLVECFPVLSGIVELLRGYSDAITFVGEKGEKIKSILQRMCGETEQEQAISILSLISILGSSEQRVVLGQYHKQDIIKQRLALVRIYVSCNSSRTILIDDIARYVGMNRSSFCTFFRQATGKTFVEHLNEYRIERACRMLQEGVLSVAEICFACGFNDIAYFSRVFKRYRGIAPSLWQRES